MEAEVDEPTNVDEAEPTGGPAAVVKQEPPDVEENPLPVAPAVRKITPPMKKSPVGKPDVQPKLSASAGMNKRERERAERERQGEGK